MDKATYQYYTFMALQEHAKEQAKLHGETSTRNANQGNDSMAYYNLIAAMNGGPEFHAAVQKMTRSEPMPIASSQTKIDEDNWYVFDSAGFDSITDNEPSPPSCSTVPPPTPVNAVTPPSVDRFAPLPKAVNTADNFAQYVANHPKKNDGRSNNTQKRSGMLIDF